MMLLRLSMWWKMVHIHRSYLDQEECVVAFSPIVLPKRELVPNSVHLTS